MWGAGISQTAPTRAMIDGVVGAGRLQRPKPGRATGTELQPMRAKGDGPSKAMLIGSSGAFGGPTLPQCVQEMGHGVKDCSYVVCLTVFWTHLGPITPFFLPTSPLWNINACLVSVLPLCFENT